MIDDEITLTKLAWMAVCTPSLDAQEALVVLVDALLEKGIIESRGNHKRAAWSSGMTAFLEQQWLLMRAWYWAKHRAVTIDRIVEKQEKQSPSIARVPLSFPPTLLAPLESRFVAVNPAVSFRGDRLVIDQGFDSVSIDDLVIGNVRSFISGSVPGTHFAIASSAFARAYLDLPTLHPNQMAELHVTNVTDVEVQFSAVLFGRTLHQFSEDSEDPIVRAMRDL